MCKCNKAPAKQDSCMTYLFVVPALTPELRVITHAMISMIENHLAWVLLWWRVKYRIIKGYQVYLQNVLATYVPKPILNFCDKTYGRKFKKFTFYKDLAHPLQDAMNESFPDLMRLLSRIEKRAFHDWDDIYYPLDLNAQLPKSAKRIMEIKKGRRTAPAEKQPLPDETKESKGYEKEMELMLKPEDKKEKENYEDNKE